MCCKIMKWIAYNCLFAVAYLLLLPRFFMRMWQRGGYRRGFFERFAFYTLAQIAALKTAPRIWIHAVSVGEMFVALAFMREIKQRNPELGFVVTTTTSTGHALAAKRLEPDDVLLYVPVDFPWVINRAIRRIRPLALLLVEGEVWPNLVRRLNKECVPVALVNGRLSSKSFAGFMRIRGFVAEIYRLFTLFAAQGAADAGRYLTLGAPQERVAIFGSAKYDIACIDAASVQPPLDVLKRAGFPADALVIVAGSTWPGEEKILLKLFADIKSEFPSARLVLVPRHAERAPEIEAELRASSLAWIRRRSLDAGEHAQNTEVLLVDTTGELKAFYAAADIVFVGKSLTQHGGQNIMEPAALGKPVIVGPNMENFLPVMEDFLKAHALIQVNSAEELGVSLAALLRDSAARECFAERARNLVQEKSGVISATVDRLAREIPSLAHRA